MAAIEAQLAAKGFTRNDAAPDVVVLFHMAFDEQKDISTFQLRPGLRRLRLRLGRGLGATHTDVRVREILVGPSRSTWSTPRRSRWPGVAWAPRRSTRTPSRRSVRRNINKAVEKIFRNYPPKAGE